MPSSLPLPETSTLNRTPFPTPPYFQRTKRYGIHANAKSEKVKRIIVNKLKRNGRTIRTVMEIISHLMHLSPFVCQQCGMDSFTTIDLPPGKGWIHQWITLPYARAPDNRIMLS
jgi:hypothetical protein